MSYLESKSLGAFKTHLEIHTNMKEHVCHHCGRSFTQKSSMNRHINGKHLSQIRTSIVKKRSLYEGDTEEYDLEDGSDGNDYLCPYCSLTIKNYRQYQTHIQTEHPESSSDSTQETSGAKKTCQVCYKTFETWYFKKHILIHTGERPYTSDICDNSYRQSSHMLRHKRSAHSVERPYGCYICNKTY